MRQRESARSARRGSRILRIRVAGFLLVITAIAATQGCESVTSSSAAGSFAEAPGTAPHRAPGGSASSARSRAGDQAGFTRWPASGQAAFVTSGRPQVQASPDQHPVAIASVAKVMTAYLVLEDHPLELGHDGPMITLTGADVADTEQRRGRQESVVSVAAGEELTELQALEALLLPSANNIAVVLARWDAGSRVGFVDRMNAMARSLGMTNTRYTDPSGYDDATVSTAADQVRIVELAMRLPMFARIVGTPSATLPVAGVVHNTDALLGHDGFVGVKTGSDDAAGGCFAFRAVRWIDGTQATITGVVLGQPGHDQIAAGLKTAETMVDRIAGQADTPQLPLPPPTMEAGDEPHA